MKATKTTKIMGGLFIIVLITLTVWFALTLPINAEAAADITVTIDTGDEVVLKDKDADGYYDIGTADELFAFAAVVNGGTSNINVELTANIDVNPGYVFNKDGTVTYNGATVTEGWRLWYAIGNTSVNYYFDGHFNGNYYKISGLYATQANGRLGFIGTLRDNAVLENLGIDNSYFAYTTKPESGTAYVSGLVWSTLAKNAVPTIRNCWSVATVYSHEWAAGLVGSTSTYISQDTGVYIENCFYAGYISGYNNNYGFGDTTGGVTSGYFEMTNTYYDSTNMGGNRQEDGGATPATTEQFANGHVAFFMGGVFGQNIDNGGATSSYPVFNGAKVYRNGICSNPSYSNTKGTFYHDNSLIDDVYYDENDNCLVCGAKRLSQLVDLSVGGVDVVVGGEAKTTSGTGWSYNASTRTLTLSDGADISAASGSDYAIQAIGDLNVSVNGTVNLKNTFYVDGRLYLILNNEATLTVGTTKMSGHAIYAISATSNISISGTGTVNAIGSQYASSSAGINADGDLSIDGITLNAKGKRNYDDIFATNLKIGENSAAVVNCIGTNCGAIDADTVYIYNQSIVHIGPRTGTDSNYYISAHVVLDNSTLVADEITGSGAQRLIYSGLEIKGASHFLVKSITSTNSYTYIYMNSLKVDGSYYYKTSETSGYVTGGTPTKKDVSNFEVITLSHLGATSNGDGTHTLNCLSSCTHKATEVDEITCTYEYSASGATLNATCTVCGGEQSITLKAPANLVYDGTQKSAVIDGTISGITDPTLDYIGDRTNVTAEGVTADLTFGGVTASVEFKIEKATPKASDFVLSANSFTYDGTAKSINVDLSSSVEGMGAFEIVIQKNGNVVSEIIDAGEYTIIVNVLEGDNYKAIDGLIVGTVTVNPKALAEGDVSISATEATYDQSEHKPEITLNGLELDKDYTVSWNKTEFVNAGTYTATVKGIGNYSGTVTKTFTINKAELVIEVISPISSVLPGNTIALTLITNSNETAGYTLSGTGFTVVEGTTIKIDDLVIGKDKVTVNVTFDETANYYGGTSDTLTLELGMADFSGEIAKLNEKIEELSDLIAADGVSINEINNKITEIQNKITTLENVKDDYKDADAALKKELEEAINLAKQTAMDAADAALAQAKQELNAAIEKKADITALNKAIDDLNAAIELAQKTAEQFATDADADLKAALDADIAEANRLIESLDGRVTDAENAIENLNKATKALDKAMKDGDKALGESIEALKNALDEAIKAYQTADDALKSELSAKIDEAYSMLDAAIKALQKDLDETKESLEAKDKELDAKDVELTVKDNELQTMIIIVAVVAGVALCGSGAFIIWFFVDRKKRM